MAVVCIPDRQAVTPAQKAGLPKFATAEQVANHALEILQGIAGGLTARRVFAEITNRMSADAGKPKLPTAKQVEAVLDHLVKQKLLKHKGKQYSFMSASVPVQNLLDALILPTHIAAWDRPDSKELAMMHMLDAIWIAHKHSMIAAHKSADDKEEQEKVAGKAYGAAMGRQFPQFLAEVLREAGNRNFFDALGYVVDGTIKDQSKAPKGVIAVPETAEDAMNVYHHFAKAVEKAWGRTLYVKPPAAGNSEKNFEAFMRNVSVSHLDPSDAGQQEPFLMEEPYTHPNAAIAVIRGILSMVRSVSKDKISAPFQIADLYEGNRKAPGLDHSPLNIWLNPVEFIYTVANTIAKSGLVRAEVDPKAKGAEKYAALPAKHPFRQLVEGLFGWEAPKQLPVSFAEGSPTQVSDYIKRFVDVHAPGQEYAQFVAEGQFNVMRKLVALLYPQVHDPLDTPIEQSIEDVLIKKQLETGKMDGAVHVYWSTHRTHSKSLPEIMKAAYKPIDDPSAEKRGFVPLPEILAHEDHDPITRRLVGLVLEAIHFQKMKGVPPALALAARIYRHGAAEFTSLSAPDSKNLEQEGDNRYNFYLVNKKGGTTLLRSLGDRKFELLDYSGQSKGAQGRKAEALEKETKGTIYAVPNIAGGLLTQLNTLPEFQEHYLAAFRMYVVSPVSAMRMQRDNAYPKAPIIPKRAILTGIQAGGARQEFDNNTHSIITALSIYEHMYDKVSGGRSLYDQIVADNGKDILAKGLRLPDKFALPDTGKGNTLSGFLRDNQDALGQERWTGPGINGLVALKLTAGLPQGVAADDFWQAGEAQSLWSQNFRETKSSYTRRNEALDARDRVGTTLQFDDIEHLKAMLLTGTLPDFADPERTIELQERLAEYGLDNVKGARVGREREREAINVESLMAMLAQLVRSDRWLQNMMKLGGASIQTILAQSVINNGALGHYAPSTMELGVVLTASDISVLVHELMHAMQATASLTAEATKGKSFWAKDIDARHLRQAFPLLNYDVIDDWLRDNDGKPMDAARSKHLMEIYERLSLTEPYDPPNGGSSAIYQDLLIDTAKIEADAERILTTYENNGHERGSVQAQEAVQKMIRTVMGKHIAVMNITPEMVSALLIDMRDMSKKMQQGFHSKRTTINRPAYEALQRIEQHGVLSASNPQKSVKQLLHEFHGKQGMDATQRMISDIELVLRESASEAMDTPQGAYFSSSAERGARLMQAVLSSVFAQLDQQVAGLLGTDVQLLRHEREKISGYNFSDETVQHARGFLENYFNSAVLSGQAVRTFKPSNLARFRFNRTPDHMLDELARQATIATSGKDLQFDKPPAKPAPGEAIGPIRDEINIVYLPEYAAVTYRNKLIARTTPELAEALQTRISESNYWFEPFVAIKMLEGGVISDSEGNTHADRMKLDRDLRNAVGLHGKKIEAQLDKISLADLPRKTRDKPDDPLSIINQQVPFGQWAHQHADYFKINGKDINNLAVEMTTPRGILPNIQPWDAKTMTGVMKLDDLAKDLGLTMEEMEETLFPFGVKSPRSPNKLQILSLLMKVSAHKRRYQHTLPKQGSIGLRMAESKVEQKDFVQYAEGFLAALGTGAGKTRLMIADHALRAKSAAKQAAAYRKEAAKKGKVPKGMKDAQVHLRLWQTDPEYKAIVSRGITMTVTGGAEKDALELGSIADTVNLGLIDDPKLNLATLESTLNKQQGVIPGKEGKSYRWIEASVRASHLRRAYKNGEITDPNDVPWPGDYIHVPTYEWMREGNSKVETANREIVPLPDHANDPARLIERQGHEQKAILRIKSLARPDTNLRMLYTLLGIDAVLPGAENWENNHPSEMKFPKDMWETSHWYWWQGALNFDEADAIVNVNEQGEATGDDSSKTGEIGREMQLLLPKARVGLYTATPWSEPTKIIAYARQLSPMLNQHFTAIENLIDMLKVHPNQRRLLMATMVGLGNAVAFNLPFNASAVTTVNSREATVWPMDTTAFRDTIGNEIKKKFDEYGAMLIRAGGNRDTSNFLLDGQHIRPEVVTLPNGEKRVLLKTNNRQLYTDGFWDTLENSRKAMAADMDKLVRDAIYMDPQSLELDMKGNNVVVFINRIYNSNMRRAFNSMRFGPHLTEVADNEWTGAYGNRLDLANVLQNDVMGRMPQLWLLVPKLAIGEFKSGKQANRMQVTAGYHTMNHYNFHRWLVGKDKRVKQDGTPDHPWDVDLDPLEHIGRIEDKVLTIYIDKQRQADGNPQKYYVKPLLPNSTTGKLLTSAGKFAGKISPPIHLTAGDIADILAVREEDLEFLGELSDPRGDPAAQVRVRHPKETESDSITTATKNGWDAMGAIIGTGMIANGRFRMPMDSLREYLLSDQTEKGKKDARPVEVGYVAGITIRVEYDPANQSNGFRIILQDPDVEKQIALDKFNMPETATKKDLKTKMHLIATMAMAARGINLNKVNPADYNKLFGMLDFGPSPNTAVQSAGRGNRMSSLPNSYRLAFVKRQTIKPAMEQWKQATKIMRMSETSTGLPDAMLPLSDKFPDMDNKRAIQTAQLHLLSDMFRNTSKYSRRHTFVELMEIIGVDNPKKPRDLVGNNNVLERIDKFRQVFNSGALDKLPVESHPVVLEQFEEGYFRELDFQVRSGTSNAGMRSYEGTLEDAGAIPVVNINGEEDELRLYRLRDNKVAFSFDHVENLYMGDRNLKKAELRQRATFHVLRAQGEATRLRYYPDNKTGQPISRDYVEITFTEEKGEVIDIAAIKEVGYHILAKRDTDKLKNDSNVVSYKEGVDLWNKLNEFQAGEPQRAQNIIGFSGFFTQHEIITPTMMRYTQGVTGWFKGDGAIGTPYEPHTITAFNTQLMNQDIAQILGELLRDATPDMVAWEGTKSDPGQFVQAIRKELDDQSAKGETSPSIRLDIKKVGRVFPMAVVIQPTTEEGLQGLSISAEELIGSGWKEMGISSLLDSRIIPPETKLHILQTLFGFDETEFDVSGFQRPDPEPGTADQPPLPTGGGQPPGGTAGPSDAPPVNAGEQRVVDLVVKSIKSKKWKVVIEDMAKGQAMKQKEVENELFAILPRLAKSLAKHNANLHDEGKMEIVMAELGFSLDKKDK